MVRIGFSDCGKIEINMSSKSFGNKSFDFKLKHLNILSIVYHPALRNKTFFWREAITFEKRITVAIWRLSTGNSYRATSQVFGIGLLTACKLLAEFCTAACHLVPQFISFR